jgi:exonuclease VII large subunit
MKLGRWLICLLVLSLPLWASAEFYRYIDENGNIHYTDDLSTVPENQQSDIYEYGESQRNEYDNQENEQSAVKSKPLFEEKQTQDQNETDDLTETKRRLDRKKEEFDKEYKALMQERARIAKDNKNLKSRSAAKKYNKSISKFNEKIADYETRKKVFDAEVEEYNARVQKDVLKNLGTPPPSE